MKVTHNGIFIWLLAIALTSMLRPHLLLVPYSFHFLFLYKNGLCTSCHAAGLAQILYSATDSCTICAKLLFVCLTVRCWLLCMCVCVCLLVCYYTKNCTHKAIAMQHLCRIVTSNEKVQIKLLCNWTSEQTRKAMRRCIHVSDWNTGIFIVAQRRFSSIFVAFHVIWSIVYC